MATDNPFASILTPENLKAGREAVIDEKYKGAGFWGQQMAQAGGQVRQALREKGMGLDANDRKAALNQIILQSSAQSYAGMVKDGMDPDEARIGVLEETMNQFMASGEYSTAMTLLPQIEQLKKIKAERRKLNSEAAYNETIKGEVETAKAEAAKARARAAETTAGAAVTRADATADRVDAQNAEDLASAGLKDRTDPNIRAGKGGGADKDGTPKINASTRAGIIQQVAGGLGLISRAGQYRTMLSTRPEVGAPPAQWAAWMNSQARGALASVGGGVSPDALSEADRAAYVAKAADTALAARRLNVDVASFRSLSLDLAYAIARAREPGGRLTNQDFDTALKILGGDPDASAALRTLDNTIKNSVRDIRNTVKGWPGLDKEIPTYAELEAAEAEWNKVTAPVTPTTPGAPRPRAGGSAADRMRAIEGRLGGQ